MSNSRFSTSRLSIQSGIPEEDEHGISCLPSKQTCPEWTYHRKHFFILSSAGKPIYSRYGNEIEVASLMGLVQAIMSFFLDQDDQLKSIVAGQRLFVFLAKGPLYFLAVSTLSETESQLMFQLNQLHRQVVSSLTQYQIDRIFQRSSNFDLRTLLQGSESHLHNLSSSFHDHTGYVMKAYPVIKMPLRVRDRLLRCLSVCSPPKALLFGFLVKDRNIIVTTTQGRHSICALDILVLLNAIQSTSTLRTVEAWTPLCLPLFNDAGFLHLYVCYVEDDICLALLSPSKDAFFELSEFKGRVVEELNGEPMSLLQQSIRAFPFSIVELGISGLRHFIYKSIPLEQYIEPSPLAPYTKPKERLKLLRRYHRIQDLAMSKRLPSTMLGHFGKSEIICFVGTPTSHIYAAFNPLISPKLAWSIMAEIEAWVKQFERRLFTPPFVLNQPSALSILSP